MRQDIYNNFLNILLASENNKHMNLSFKKCDIKNLDELVEISRITFINAFEKDNNPEDFNNYMRSAFSKETIEVELLNPKAL